MPIGTGFFYLCCLGVKLAWSADSNSSSQPTNNYDRLIRSLLKDDRYDKRVPPSVFNETAQFQKPVVVVVDVQIYRILGIDEELQTISAYIYVMEYWNDSRLIWNPLEYGNITSITLPVDQIWSPDTRISQVQIMNYQDQSDKTHATVNYNGIVDMTYPSLAEEVCTLELTNFPFDDQLCSFYINTKASRPYMVRYRKATSKPECTLRSDLLVQDSSEWMLQSCYVTVDYDSVLSLHTVGLQIDMSVRRQSLYHIVNLFAPAVTIAILNTVGLFANVDAETSEMDASSLGMTSLLALSVMLLQASDQIPKGSTTISLLGLFYILIVLQTLVATFVSLYLRNVDRRTYLQRLLHQCWHKTTPKTVPVEIRNAKPRNETNCCVLFTIGHFCMLVNILFILCTSIAIVVTGMSRRRGGTLSVVNVPDELDY